MQNFKHNCPCAEWIYTRAARAARAHKHKLRKTNALSLSLFLHCIGPLSHYCPLAFHCADCHRQQQQQQQSKRNYFDLKRALYKVYGEEKRERANGITLHSARESGRFGFIWCPVRLREGSLLPVSIAIGRLADRQTEPKEPKRERYTLSRSGTFLCVAGAVFWPFGELASLPIEQTVRDRLC